MSSLKYDTYVPLAQSVEHLTFNQGVEGSNPSWYIVIYRQLISIELLNDISIPIAGETILT